MRKNQFFRRASVVIVTKNRAHLLRLCLKSLEIQALRPKEIVIVDNGSTDDTKQVLDDFSSRLPMRVVMSKALGYPSVYNAGIRGTSGAWIIFFDDDCIAPPSWSTQMNAAIQKTPLDVIQGKVVSMPAGNIYAEIMGDHYQNWINQHTIGPSIMDTFDNKNLCVPAKTIATNGEFDESLVYGSEDIEMGKRYFKNGVKIIYEPTVVAFHRERTGLSGFVKQHIRIAKSEAILDSQLSTGEKIGMIKKSKTRLLIKSILSREARYLFSGNLMGFFYLPILYGILATIRVWTYYTSTWNIRKSAL